MIDLVLEIRDFGWTVHFHCAVTCYHAKQIVAELRELDCPQPILKRANDLLTSCARDTGITYSNANKRESVVVVGLTTSAAEFQNSLQHEIRHLVDDLVLSSQYYDKEDIAYLTGEINRSLFPHVHGLLCDGCRKRREI